MWEYHNQKMIKLKETYQKISKQTQTRLQEIFNFDELNNLYNIADNKFKKKTTFSKKILRKWSLSFFEICDCSLHQACCKKRILFPSLLRFFVGSGAFGLSSASENVFAREPLQAAQKRPE